MAIWLVKYWPCLKCDLDDPGSGRELPRFRIVPEGEPDRWIAQTNADLPPDAQEEAALIMADALSKALGG